jgi:C4-dicarboxylate-specific signal transduction histidine kinase
VREQLTAWVDGRVVRMVVATDITAQREAIEAELQQMAQLHQTARLITLGEMASMLAHELNQPIAAIANYCRGALLRWRQGRLDPEVVGEVLQKAAEQAERAGTIVRRIRAFARQSAPQQQWVDAVTIAREAIELLRVDAQRRGVTVRTQLPQDGVMISADKILLEQVLVNLIRNAFDAMQSVPPKQRELTLMVTETDEEVCYRIADRGVGISEEVRSRLDTPFFTTKPDDLGLGLRICRAILEAHKGRLALLARPGGGTVAEVWLPRAQGGVSHDAQG